MSADEQHGDIRERTREEKLAALAEKGDQVGEDLAELADAHLQRIRREKENES